MLLSGAQGYVLGPVGRAGLGGLPPGSYRVFATLNGEDQLIGSVDLQAGQIVQFSCGFGTCKRMN